MGAPFRDNQLVRVIATGKTGWILQGMIDNGPHAGGLVLYEVQMRDGLKTVEYLRPDELKAVLRKGKHPILRPEKD